MKHYIFFIFILFSSIAWSQDTLSELLKKHNTNSVPYISVQELAMPKTDAIILDARELYEFEVSHLKDAIFVGYTTFNLDEVIKNLPNKNETIVVYCSLGIRSETIAEQLKKVGYTNVYNVYGGIFEWKNNGFSVVDTKDNETENIHVFNKHWSKWLTKGIKVFDIESNQDND
ncbi:rhodanese-like domain-containing protein [Olleya aquimaris]|uniref:Rhodanese-related sulfurtransferase n=1 Tax=Olleya aquimaris TaxID=639310 RepID=A0A327RDM1_9FLAO|nr:rhodanese-like domain-containing protein [Olleya aquimaris]RAJ15106.1 rhodanese-related sulfurtransferase [Olleya aquimaris]